MTFNLQSQVRTCSMNGWDYVICSFYMPGLNGRTEPESHHLLRSNENGSETYTADGWVGRSKTILGKFKQPDYKFFDSYEEAETVIQQLMIEDK